MELPIELREKIECNAEKYGINALMSAANALFDRYKNESGAGKRLSVTEAETAAYAVVRMPATYSAVSSALRLTAECFSGEIKTVLDAGAGTGAASLVVYDFFEGLESITAIEREAEMQRLGKTLTEALPIEWKTEDLRRFEADKTYDLVICSYAMNELSDSDRKAVLERLWRCTGKLLLIVETGTSIGFAQLKYARKYLLSENAKIAAPCPEIAECPLDENDWCHFVCRVGRSRLHKKLKGGDAPYEDEKYSFIAATRGECQPCNARILRHPKIESGHILLTLCESGGISERHCTKKDKDGFKAARKADCGDIFKIR